MHRFKYVGGVDRIDIWRDLNTTGTDALLMVWDDAPGEWIFWTDTRPSGYAVPTPEERNLVLRYASLFVPELGLVMEEADGT